MKCFATLLSLVATFPAARGIAFEGVAPTATKPGRVDGITPKPTNGPSVAELRKRQTSSDQEICGWVNGDYNQPATCPVALTCMLYTSATVGMVGCCSGFDSQDCGWSNSCVDAKAYAAGECDTNCRRNSFVRKCTAATAPYCNTWTLPGNDIIDYGCTDVSSNTVYTVLQRGTDTFGDSTSIQLRTLSGSAVTGYDETITAEPTDVLSGGGSGSSRRKAGKTVAIGLIVGIVIAVLFVVFFVLIAVCICLKRKKKQRLIADNAQAVAAAQANHPQSQYPLPQHQPQMDMQQQPHMQMEYQQPQMHMQQQPPVMPSPSPQQSPLPMTNGYLPPISPADQKFNTPASVHEYAPSPISNPSTPAPVYGQSQYGVPAGPPTPTPAMNQYPNSGNGAHEVDAISVPRVPVHGGPVYEIGQGR